MWKVPKQRSFCLHGFGVHPPPPRTWMCSPTWKLSVPCTVGVFMEVSSYRFDQLLIQSLPHFSPGSRGGRTERSKLLILAWFFLQQAPTQEPTRSCLLRPKKKKKITGNLRGLGVLLQETGQRANTYFVFCHPGSYRYFFPFPALTLTLVSHISHLKLPWLQLWEKGILGMLELLRILMVGVGTQTYTSDETV